MTTNITEGDVTITDLNVGTQHGRTARYRLDGRTEATVTLIPMGRMADNRADALELRAEIIDGLAGAGQVGDTVRIGTGQATYEVTAVHADGTFDLRQNDGLGTQTRRSIDPYRLHAVRVTR